MTLQVNRNIISALLHIPQNRVELLTLRERERERERAENCSAVPLSIANGDGSQVKASWWMLLTQREMKIPHKHPVKTFQILSWILLLWFEHWLYYRKHLKISLGKLLRYCQSDAAHCTLWVTHKEKYPSNPRKGRKGNYTKSLCKVSFLECTTWVPRVFEK